MRLSRIIMALTVGLAVAAVPTAAGAAQPQPQPSVTQPPVYPPGGGVELSVDDPQIVLGETVTLFGRGWNAGELIRIEVTSTPLATAMSAVRGSSGDRVAMTPVAYRPRHEHGIGSFHARADGTFERGYTPRRTGHFTFRAIGDTGRTATAKVTVLHKKKGKLPVTGDSTSTPMKVGGGLVGVGAVLLLMTFAWRQRHRFHTRGVR